MSSNASRLALLVARARDSRGVIVQYLRYSDRLCLFPWPTIGGSPVKPRDIEDYCNTYQMVRPSCLCPMIHVNGPDVVESAICVSTTGPFSGEYVAMCARDECGYLVPVERLYNKAGVPSREYPLRALDERVPPQVVHVSQNEALRAQTEPADPPARPLKRTYAMIDINEGFVAKRRAPSGKSVSTLLALLDSRTHPGVTKSGFRSLFAECECGLIMTRRVFKEHMCQREVIDLTSED